MVREEIFERVEEAIDEANIQEDREESEKSEASIDQ